MAAVYTLKVLTDFGSAHSLRHYPGDCARLHGHNWKVEVEVVSRVLNELGIAIDFKAVKQAARDICGELDHRYLNEIPPFDTLNPTAENIAGYLYQRIGEKVNSEHVQVHAITLWETDNACVRYTEED